MEFWIENPTQGLTYTWSCNEPLWQFKNGVKTGDTITIIMDNKNPATLTVQAAYSGGGCEPSESSRFITRALSSSVSYVTPVNNCFLPNDAQLKTFILNEYPSGSKFTWTKPYGWTGEENQTGSTFRIMATPNAHLIDSVEVSVEGCEASVVKTNVYVKPGNAAAISGDYFCVQKYSSYTFSTTATVPAANSYEWSMPGWNIVSGQGTLTVVAVPTGNISTISVTPKGYNNCNGNPSSAVVSYPPTAPIGIDNPSKNCINSGMEDEITLSVTEGTDNQYYDWNLDGLGTINGTTNGASINVTTSGIDESYNVTVRSYTNSTVCPYSGTVSRQVDIQGLAFSIDVYEEDDDVYAYVLSPIDWSPYTYNFVWRINGIIMSNGNGLTFFISSIPDLLSSASSDIFDVTITKSACSTFRVLTGMEQPRSKSKSAKTASLANVQSASYGMSVYPNPAQDRLNVSLQNTGQIAVRIIDMKGNIVKYIENLPEESTIDIANISNGMYIVSVEQNNILYQKVILIRK